SRNFRKPAERAPGSARGSAIAAFARGFGRGARCRSSAAQSRRSCRCRSARFPPGPCPSGPMVWRRSGSGSALHSRCPQLRGAILLKGRGRQKTLNNPGKVEPRLLLANAAVASVGLGPRQKACQGMWGFAAPNPSRSPARLESAAMLHICHSPSRTATGKRAADQTMQDTHGHRQLTSGILFLVLCIAIVIAAVFAIRSIRVQNPASHRARALLNLDAALDATLEPLDQTSARLLGGGGQADDMVVTSVASGGRASRAGIRVGDFVEQIGGKDPSD